MLFAPRVSLIHGLDPRSKIIVWIVIATPAILSYSILVSLSMFLLTIAIALIAGVAKIYVSNLMKVILPVFIPVILIQGLFNPVGKTTVIYLLPWLSFKREGLVFAAILLSRLLAIFGGAYLLNLTTRPSDFMASMQKMGLPLKVAYPLFSALQIVPVIQMRLQMVKEAQMARGLKLQRVSIIRRLSNFIPLLTPLLLGAIEEAYRRSIALEARGFSSNIKKTFLSDIRFHAADAFFVLGITTSTLILSLWLTSLIPHPNPWSL